MILRTLPRQVNEALDFSGPSLSKKLLKLAGYFDPLAFSSLYF